MSVLRVRLTRGAVLRGMVFKDFVDLVREAAGRADLPVARTKRGVPRIDTGPHLAPTHTSQCEYMDFELSEPITGSEFTRRLATELPEGVAVKSARLDLRRSVSRLEARPGEVIMDIEVRAEGTPKPEEVLASVFGMPQEEALLLETERSGVRFSDAPPARA